MQMFYVYIWVVLIYRRNQARVEIAFQIYTRFLFSTWWVAVYGLFFISGNLASPVFWQFNFVYMEFACMLSIRLPASHKETVLLKEYLLVRLAFTVNHSYFISDSSCTAKSWTELTRKNNMATIKKLSNWNSTKISILWTDSNHQMFRHHRQANSNCYSMTKIFFLR